jgi:spermidine/putrescine-binding protein
MNRLYVPEKPSITRRNVLKGAGAAGLVLAAGTIPGARERARAAESATIRGYGVVTAELKDWSILTKSTGLTMEFTPTNTDVGVFMRDIIATGIGEEQDFFVFDGGLQQILGPQGYLLVIDTKHPELTLWDRTPDEFKATEAMQDLNGVQYGIPMVFNADSFGFWPEECGVADPPPQVTWELVYESEKTKGRVALDKEWGVTMPEAASWLNVSGRAQIKDVTNLTAEEARQVSDFLIERKRAGQFRTFYASFDEQVELLGNKEVYAMPCWEPAVLETNLQHGKEVTYYAYAEYHFKWGHAMYLPVEAQDRGNLDNIYKTANWFLGGEYAAYQVLERGYVGPNSDLAVEYAKGHDWPEEQIQTIMKNGDKINKKYKLPFWGNYAAPNKDVMEEEMERVMNA